MRKKKEARKMTKSDFFGGLFLSSHILKGAIASILVNCWAVSFYLHAWFVAFWPLSE